MDNQEQDTYLPPDIQFQLQRRAIVMGIAKGLVIGGLALGDYYLYSKLLESAASLDLFSSEATEDDETRQSPTATPMSPNPSPSVPSTKATSQTPVERKTFVPPKDPFFVGPFNLEGFRKTDGKLTPAPHLFLFTNLPDGTTIQSYVWPKALEPTDNLDTVFDWRNPVNVAILNVTGERNGYVEGFVRQTGHSAIVPLVWTGPWEGFRKFLEENKRKFTPDEFDVTVANLMRSETILMQGNLAPAPIDPDYVMNHKGQGLLNPNVSRAFVKGVMRLTPEKTNEWDQATLAALKKPGTLVNILNYVDSKKLVSINPATDIVFEFCGQKLFPGEHRVTGVSIAQTTRYLVVVSLKQ